MLSKAKMKLVDNLDQLVLKKERNFKVLRFIQLLKI